MVRFRDGFTSTGATAGLIALFAVTGGTAIAKPLIGSKDIKNHSITSTDIKNGAINSASIGNESVLGADIKNNTVTGADVKNSTITGADITDGTVTGSDVNENSLGSVPNALAVNGVSTRVYEGHTVPSATAKAVTVFTGRSFKVTATCGKSPASGSQIAFDLRLTATKDRIAEQYTYNDPVTSSVVLGSGEFNADDEDNFELLRRTKDGVESGTILVSDQQHHATELRWYARVEALPGEGPLECSTNIFATERR